MRTRNRFAFFCAALLLLLLLATCAAAQPLDWALVQCQVDITCRARFFLESSPSEYTGVLFAHLYGQWTAAVGAPVTFNTSNDESAQLWLSAVRQAVFCDANMVFVVGPGCVCPHGKHCGVHEDPNFLFDFSSLETIVAVFALALACSWHWTVHQRFAALQANALRLRQEVNAPTTTTISPLQAQQQQQQQQRPADLISFTQ